MRRAEWNLPVWCALDVFWAHELGKVLLFTDPAQAEGLPQLPDGVDAH